eukprot:7336196-Pyramimonas_sp.AAC.2
MQPADPSEKMQAADWAWCDALTVPTACATTTKQPIQAIASYCLLLPLLHLIASYCLFCILLPI